MRRVGEIIEDGAERHTAQREALDMVERKLTESERRRILDSERMITEAQAMTFVRTLVAIVYRYVPEEERRAAISADVLKLMQEHQSQKAING